MTKRFEDIVAWQKAHQFAVMTYRVTRTFPDFEKFGLCSQFQRAAVSIAANSFYLPLSPFIYKN
jgi:hypothetical protein